MKYTQVLKYLAQCPACFKQWEPWLVGLLSISALVFRPVHHPREQCLLCPWTMMAKILWMIPVMEKSYFLSHWVCIYMSCFCVTVSKIRDRGSFRKNFFCHRYQSFIVQKASLWESEEAASHSSADEEAEWSQNQRWIPLQWCTSAS